MGATEVRDRLTPSGHDQDDSGASSHVCRAAAVATVNVDVTALATGCIRSPTGRSASGVPFNRIPVHGIENSEVCDSTLEPGSRASGEMYLSTLRARTPARPRSRWRHCPQGRLRCGSPTALLIRLSTLAYPEQTAREGGTHRRERADESPPNVAFREAAMNSMPVNAAAFSPVTCPAAVSAPGRRTVSVRDPPARHARPGRHDTEPNRLMQRIAAVLLTATGDPDVVVGFGERRSPSQGNWPRACGQRASLSPDSCASSTTSSGW